MVPGAAFGFWGNGTMNGRWFFGAAALAIAGCAPDRATVSAVAAPDTDPVAFAATMSPGWNLGNALEAIGPGPRPRAVSQETAWGNPRITQDLFDAVAAAGFRSVRIPVAWQQYADDGTDRIDPAWLDRVGEVVAQARAAGLTVMLNMHWDEGWLQPTYAAQPRADAQLRAYWKQIAEHFRDADERVLFAGTNEVMVTGDYGPPTEEYCEVQNGFNRLFVETVRATGGANASRFLIVQGFNTNIDYTLACNAVLPADPATDRLMMEVHFYDPYELTISEDSGIWQWGAGATDPASTKGGANEAFADAQFAKMQRAFVDRGVPVILGEYAAMAKFEHDPDGTYRTAWNAYITRSAVAHGLVPVYWDNGGTGNHASGVFDRTRARIAYPDAVAAIVEAGGR